jgi:hypothetical protein
MRDGETLRNLHPPSPEGPTERNQAILRGCLLELCGASHVVLLVNECALAQISNIDAGNTWALEPGATNRTAMSRGPSSAAILSVRRLHGVARSRRSFLGDTTWAVASEFGAVGRLSVVVSGRSSCDIRAISSGGFGLWAVVDGAEQ